MRILISVVYALILGIVSHYFGESLPRKLFSADRFPFRPFFWERDGKIYERLHIRQWKTRVPDMSRYLKDMLPKRLTPHATAEEVETLAIETCIAEFVHDTLCILAVGFYFIWKNFIGVILAVIFFLGNLPFIFIQRYNRPHLRKLAHRLAKKEENRQNASADFIL